MIHNYIQNKYSYILPFVAVISMLLFNSCDDSSTGTEDPEPEIEANTVENVNADGQYAYFSLRTGEIVDQADSASTDWDIAFNSTAILVNSGTSGPGSGGAVVLDVAFNAVTIAPSDGYSVDGETLAIPTGTDNGWYHYTGPTGNPPHKIIPLPDKTIVVRTADGNHYAKLQIISYYKDNPDLSSEEYQNNSEAYPHRYYTFEYVIQLTEGLRELN